MASDKRVFEKLLERTQEPVYGIVNLPEKFRSDRVKDIISLDSRIGIEEKPLIQMKNCANIPDISFTNEIDKESPFSIYFPKHRQVAIRLIQLFMDCKTTEDLVCLAVYCRDRINTYLYNYVLSIAILHRTDTKDFKLPSMAEVFPDKYLQGEVIHDALEVIRVLPASARTPISIPQDFSATFLDDEQRIAYFREDIGLNLFYWYYNLAYPSHYKGNSKKKRGELFYYFHQQIISRYNFERLCNKLPRVKRFNNFYECIPEGYFSKLNPQVASHNWPARFDNSYLSDICRPDDGLVFDLSGLERWRDRILEAIDLGFALTSDGAHTQINNLNGIDILGNLIQSSILSINKKYYGDLANIGLLFFALCHDPTNKHLESIGVIGDCSTALRDPIFYRWYALIIDILQNNKNNLNPYIKEDLNYPGVKIEEFDVIILSNTNTDVIKNELQTFWKQSDLNLSRGLDFTPREPVYVRLIHLDHRPFQFKIKIKNNAKAMRTGIIRIFMAPKCDERGHIFSFDEQRLLMVELDKFEVTLNPGVNSIIRRSKDSSILEWLTDVIPKPIDDIEVVYQFSGYGWPEHLLIPKGTPEGFPCDLFVIVSNDVTKDNKKDTRALGFPFDRPIDRSKLVGDNINWKTVKIVFFNQTMVASTLEKPTPAVPEDSKSVPPDVDTDADTVKNS